MNITRSLPLIAAITLGGLAACNYSSECWYYGEGSENAGAGPGGGVIIPTGPAGVGGYGEAPPKQPQDATHPELKCNSDESNEADETNETNETNETENPCRGGGDTDGKYIFCSDPCPQNDAQCMSGVISYFKPKNFKFATIVADDGSGWGGGWQEAKAGLIFLQNTTGLAACTVRIGMPLRSHAWGNVPPDIAAIYTAKVANAAADKLYKTGGADLPSGIFCSNFRTEMEKQFAEQFKGMGVKVNSP